MESLNTRQMTLKQIAQYLAQADKVSETMQAALAQDPRAGVQKLLRQYQARQKQNEQEAQRLAKLSFFEREKWQQGMHLIAGIDEVGRGPLAGPVVAAAVILPPTVYLPGINDSKQLSPAQREKLYQQIRQQAVGIGLGIIDAATIDRLNILQATYLAMRQAVQQLPVKPQCLFVDALTIPQLEIVQQAIVKGDSRSISIAAASIIAKVTRDRLMVDYAKLYPEYGFDRNCGYGTAEHLAALAKYGPCAIHRCSFTPVRERLMHKNLNP